MIAQFIGGNLWRTAALVLLGVCGSLALWIFGFPVVGGGLIAKIDRVTALNASNVESHRATKRTYRAAMEQAQRLEAVRLVRVKAEQERINDRAQETFDYRFAALRARYDSLRPQGGTGSASAAGAEPMPSLPVPTFGADAAAGSDRLSLAERYECSVNALQLDELISWVDAQTKVKVND